jgi:hypothetical protein
MIHSGGDHSDSTVWGITLNQAIAHNRAVTLKSICAVAAVTLCALVTTPPGLAQTAPTATPLPSPSATPAAPSDPCGSILSIVTRPTVTTSVCNVRSGHVLIENGYTNTTVTGADGGTLINYPQSFIRVGLSQHTEISLTPPSYNRSSLGDTLETGASDANLGVKWELGYNEKALWGVNAQISEPTGTAAFSAGHAQYTGNFNWGYALSSIFSASGTLGFNSLAGPTPSGQIQQYFAFIPTLELTAALPGSSQIFGEYAYFSHAGPTVGGRTLFDFGYQRDFGDRLQFDIEYGFQPTVIDSQQQHYFGAGLSFMN